MIHHSYACRLGKGTHRAIVTLRRFLASGGWVLKLDIRKDFYSIDPEILLTDL
mgnify:CR=1 FL=1